MRHVTWLGILCAAGLTALAACGGSESTSGSAGTSDGGTGGAPTSSSSTGMGGMTTSTGTGATGGGGTGGSAPTLVNGCDPATATDHTADANVAIAFGANGFTYEPKCIKVKAGTDVTFNGMFSFHPLSAGTTGVPPTPDPNSPIKATSTGTTATFTMTPEGTYPYYCVAHQPGMAGAIFVVP